MWLGFTNTCMKKVANYIAQNIENLSKIYYTNPTHKTNKALETLVGRIKHYNDRHRRCNKIAHIVGKIESIHKTEKDNSQKKQEPEPIKTTIPQTSPVISVPTPAPASSPPPETPTIAAIIPSPPSFKMPPKPISKKPPKPTPAPLPIPPAAIPQHVLDGIKEFQSLRGHVAKVAELFDKPSGPHAQTIAQDSIPAKKELKGLKKLLEDSSKDEERFAAIIQEMTQDEICHYVSIGLFKTPDPQFLYQKLCIDIFGLNEGGFERESKTFGLAVKHMTIDQIKGLSEGIGKNFNHTTVNRRIEAFHSLAHLISIHRSAQDQKILFDEIVKNPFYSNNVLCHFRNRVFTDNLLKIMTLLAKHYLHFVLRDPGLLASPVQQKPLLQAFIGSVHYDFSSNMNTHSPLENQSFLDELTSAEQDNVCVLMLNTSNSIIDPIFKLVNHIFQTDPKRGIKLFEALGDHRFYYAFCSKIRENIPQAEKEYVLYLLRDPALISDPQKQHEKLFHFLKRSMPDEKLGALEDPAFVSTLSETEIINVGRAILHSVVIFKWPNVYLFNTTIMTNAKYAVKMYKEVTKFSPTFKKTALACYCLDFSKNWDILNALEAGMDTTEKQQWDDVLVERLKKNKKYTKMTPDKQQEAERNIRNRPKWH